MPYPTSVHRTLSILASAVDPEGAALKSRTRRLDQSEPRNKTIGADAVYPIRTYHHGSRKDNYASQNRFRQDVVRHGTPRLTRSLGESQ